MLQSALETTTTELIVVYHSRKGKTPDAGHEEYKADGNPQDSFRSGTGQLRGVASQDVEDRHESEGERPCLQREAEDVQRIVPAQEDG